MHGFCTSATKSGSGKVPTSASQKTARQAFRTAAIAASSALAAAAKERAAESRAVTQPYRREHTLLVQTHYKQVVLDFPTRRITDIMKGKRERAGESNIERRVRPTNPATSDVGPGVVDSVASFRKHVLAEAAITKQKGTRSKRGGKGKGKLRRDAGIQECAPLIPVCRCIVKAATTFNAPLSLVMDGAVTALVLPTSNDAQSSSRKTRQNTLKQLLGLKATQNFICRTQRPIKDVVHKLSRSAKERAIAAYQACVTSASCNTAKLPGSNGYSRETHSRGLQLALATFYAEAGTLGPGVHQWCEDVLVE